MYPEGRGLLFSKSRQSDLGEGGPDLFSFAERPATKGLSFPALRALSLSRVEPAKGDPAAHSSVVKEGKGGKR